MRNTYQTEHFGIMKETWDFNKLTSGGLDYNNVLELIDRIRSIVESEWNIGIWEEQLSRCVLH